MSSSLLSSRIDTTSAAAHPRPFAKTFAWYEHDDIGTDVGSFIDNGSRPAILPFRGDRNENLFYAGRARSFPAVDETHRSTPRATSVRPLPADLLKKLFIATAQEEERIAREDARRRAEDEAKLQDSVRKRFPSHKETHSPDTHETEKHPASLHIPSPPSRAAQPPALEDLRAILPQSSGAAQKRASRQHQEEEVGARAPSSRKEAQIPTKSASSKEVTNTSRKPSPPPTKSSLPPHRKEQDKIASSPARTRSSHTSTKTIRIKGKDGKEAFVEIFAVLPGLSTRTSQAVESQGHRPPSVKPQSVKSVASTRSSHHISLSNVVKADSGVSLRESSAREQARDDSKEGETRASHATGWKDVGRANSHRFSGTAQDTRSARKSISTKSHDGSIANDNLSDPKKTASLINDKLKLPGEAKTTSSHHTSAPAPVVTPSHSIAATNKTSKALSSASTSVRSNTSKRTTSTGARQPYVESVSIATATPPPMTPLDHASRHASKTSAQTTTSSIHHFSDTGMQWTQTAARDGSSSCVPKTSVTGGGENAQVRGAGFEEKERMSIHHDLPVRPRASEPPSLRSRVEQARSACSGTFASRSTDERANSFEEDFATQHNVAHSDRSSNRSKTSRWRSPTEEKGRGHGEHAQSMPSFNSSRPDRQAETIPSSHLARTPDTPVLNGVAAYNWSNHTRVRTLDHSLASSYASRQNPAYTANSRVASSRSTRQGTDGGSIVSITAPRSALSSFTGVRASVAAESLSPNDSVSQISRRRRRDRSNSPDGSRRASSTSYHSTASTHEGPTIFAGKGWISPHPLSVAPTDVASPPQSAIRIPYRGERRSTFGAGAGEGVMFYDEWKRMQERGLALEAKERSRKDYHNISGRLSDSGSTQNSLRPAHSVHATKRQESDAAWQELGQGVTKADSVKSYRSPTMQSVEHSGSYRKNPGSRAGSSRHTRVSMHRVAGTERNGDHGHRREILAVSLGGSGTICGNHSDRGSWRADRTPSMAEEW